MGFWHTGYIEFHEPTGLYPPIKPSPPTFPCVHCSNVYGSMADLRNHRFESHPLHRPLMFVHGLELGIRPLRVRRKLAAADIKVERCTRAVLNGNDVSLSVLPDKIAAVTSDVCHVTLLATGVTARFELDIRVASERDLIGVEKGFSTIVGRRKLDTRAVEDFIVAASSFQSASSYCDGICTYLYGILAKERASDTSLPHDEYLPRFSRAAEELAAYDRPLAHIISAAVAFHFNHFREAARLGATSRLGQVAQRYATWIECSPPPNIPDSVGHQVTRLDSLITDWETEQIIRWATRPLPDLFGHLADVQAFLTQDLVEFDKMKLHVLLAQLWLSRGHAPNAVAHAKALRNVPALGQWSEAIIGLDIGRADAR